MKYRTTEEILAVTPEQRIEEICVDTFGPVGKEIAAEIRTSPEYVDKWQEFLENERAHHERMEKMVAEHQKWLKLCKKRERIMITCLALTAMAGMVFVGLLIFRFLT